MTTKPIKTCLVCMKKTERECSHVDCPNRKHVTAAPPETPDWYGHTRGYTPEESDE